jgi:gliding motility-associated-like protein
LTTGRHYLIGIIIIFLFTEALLGKGNDFYWTGGSGYWSDSLHWSSVSGGLPTLADDVFFDSNSFSEAGDTIIIDTTGYCHNLNWSLVINNPVIVGTQDLFISGSVVFSPAMNNDLLGNLYFIASEPDQTIQLNGDTLNSPVYFEGTGTWSFVDDFTNLGTVSLLSGTLNVSGKILNCGSFLSVGGSGKSLNIQSSQVIINSAYGSWNVDDQLNLNSDYSIIEFGLNDYSAKNIFEGGNKDYNDIIFWNDAIIGGNNLLRNVYFKPEHNYKFASGSTQTFEGFLVASGCVGPMRFSATGSGQATLAKINGDIEISFVSIKSIKGLASSPFQFKAVNCIDEGNNEGINFSTQARDVYWINGSGNWSDTTHWNSLPLNEDSDCLPQDIDNVFFNEDSFNGQDTVNVNINEVRCNNMTWSGSDEPVLKNSSGLMGIKIFGSLQFMESMKNYYNKPFYFSDTLGGRTIATAGQTLNSDVYFDGRLGGWTLLDSLDVNGKIHFLYGNLFTNDNYLSCLSFHSDSSFVRTLNLGNSEIIVKSNYNGNSISINNDSLNFNAGTSKIEISAANGCIYQYGGDTIRYNDLKFSAISGIAKINTFSDIYTTFHIVDFQSNGNIVGNNSYDTLSFSPGNFYDFASGSTQTINDDISPTGQCNGPILLKSGTNGLIARLKSDMDTLRINYTSLRDINALGSAVFIAENSVDLGNNTGWDTIIVSAPGKLFWVGGTGDWNDQMHWSLISGGPAGECVPTPYDTVIFDQNSFNDLEQYVNINLNNALAHNIDWSSAGFIPEFTGLSNSAYLRIYGSLKLNPEMDFTFPAYIWFESSDPNETIETKGIKFYNLNNNVYFDGIGGEWKLLDSLQLGDSKENQNLIQFNNGFLNTNSQYVDCFGFYSTPSNHRILSLGNSKIKVQNSWYVNGVNFDLNENQSTIEVDSGAFIHRNGSYFPYHNVYFNISKISQELFCYNADSVLFDTVVFHNQIGKMYGSLGSIFGHNIGFEGRGQVNEEEDTTSNIYIIDTLLFNSIGKVYGNDTIRNFVKFNATGTISGSGNYKNALFANNGNIFGNNSFDTLTFTPSFSYQIGSGGIQTVVDSFNILGNNCQSIILFASGDSLATVYKDTGSVFGDFIEMTKINALGNALFDAGKFSTNVDNSNIGWLFHDSALNFSLGNDISILEGETVTLCAENFNGNSTTTYEWYNCDSGEPISTDSCQLFNEKGHYCLNVYYTEGGGCVKTDDIYVGCHLNLLFDTTQVSCNGFNDGSIEMQIIVGEGPFIVNWTYDDNWISSDQNIYNLTAGPYVYTISDSEECMSSDTIMISQPDILEMNYSSFPACFNESNGSIIIEVTGGTQPYHYIWSDGSSDSLLTGIIPGQYGVTIIDDNSCPPVNKSVIVTELPEYNFQHTSSDLNCYEDGSGYIEIEGLTGGTGNYAIYEWRKDSAYFADSQDISDLMAGNYYLTVTDDYGCKGYDTVIVNEPPEIILKLTHDSNIETQGSAYLEVSGGVPPYSFLWSTGSESQSINYLAGGMYSVTVTDSNSCSVTDSVFVTVHYKVFAPTAFSPNGDNVNDELVFFEVGTDLKKIELHIFDRFGKLVYETSNINQYWNGKMNNVGNDCPVEAYTWLANLLFKNGESTIYKGNVTLLR